MIVGMNPPADNGDGWYAGFFKRDVVASRKESIEIEFGGESCRLSSLLREAWWLLMAVTAVYLVLTLASFSPADSSWSHSSADAQVRNYGGAFGAWLSDILLYLFGYSAWLSVAFCLAAIAWGYRQLGDGIRRPVPGHDLVPIPPQ